MFVWHKLMKVLHKTLDFYQLFDYQNAILSFQGCHTKIQASFWQDFGWKVPSRSGKTFWDQTSLYTCSIFHFSVIVVQNNSEDAPPPPIPPSKGAQN